MSARNLVNALTHRRRSAQELRGTLTTTSPSASMANRLLARCRRASLQDDAQTQHELLAQLASKSRGGNETNCGGDQPSEKCSHRSSISTITEDDEAVSAAAAALPVAASDAGDQTIATTDDSLDDLAAEAEDCLMPLPSTTTPRCRSGAAHRRFSSSAVPTTATTLRRRKFGTILREFPHQELFLFREEAEYSDYVAARVTGVHTEMDSVVYYELDVHLSQMKWQVLRRFSEFRRLRKRLLKHLARRQRCQSFRQCQICANILQTLEQTPFPSRRQRTPWLSNSRSAEVIADRKSKLQEFVATCLLTVRGLRQHSRLMRDSSACEISVALRMIEEFLGLSFTRFMRFLNERGVLATENEDNTNAESGTSKTIHCRDTQAPRQSTTSSVGARRATIAL